MTAKQQNRKTIKLNTIDLQTKSLSFSSKVISSLVPNKHVEHYKIKDVTVEDAKLLNDQVASTAGLKVTDCWIPYEKIYQNNKFDVGDHDKQPNYQIPDFFNTVKMEEKTEARKDIFDQHEDTSSDDEVAAPPVMMDSDLTKVLCPVGKVASYPVTYNLATLKTDLNLCDNEDTTLQNCVRMGSADISNNFIACSTVSEKSFDEISEATYTEKSSSHEDSENMFNDDLSSDLVECKVKDCTEVMKDKNSSWKIYSRKGKSPGKVSSSLVEPCHRRVCFRSPVQSVSRTSSLIIPSNSDANFSSDVLHCDLPHIKTTTESTASTRSNGFLSNVNSRLPSDDRTSQDSISSSTKKKKSFKSFLKKKILAKAFDFVKTTSSCGEEVDKEMLYLEWLETRKQKQMAKLILKNIKEVEKKIPSSIKRRKFVECKLFPSHENDMLSNDGCGLKQKDNHDTTSLTTISSVLENEEPTQASKAAVKGVKVYNTTEDEKRVNKDVCGEYISKITPSLSKKTHQGLISTKASISKSSIITSKQNENANNTSNVTNQANNADFKSERDSDACNDKPESWKMPSSGYTNFDTGTNFTLPRKSPKQILDLGRNNEEDIDCNRNNTESVVRKRSQQPLIHDISEKQKHFDISWGSLGNVKSTESLANVTRLRSRASRSDVRIWQNVVGIPNTMHNSTQPQSDVKPCRALLCNMEAERTNKSWAMCNNNSGSTTSLNSEYSIQSTSEDIALAIHGTAELEKEACDITSSVTTLSGITAEGSASTPSSHVGYEKCIKARGSSSPKPEKNAGKLLSVPPKHLTPAVFDDEDCFEDALQNPSTSVENNLSGQHHHYHAERMVIKNTFHRNNSKTRISESAIGLYRNIHQKDFHTIKNISANQSSHSSTINLGGKKTIAPLSMLDARLRLVQKQMIIEKSLKSLHENQEAIMEQLDESTHVIRCIFEDEKNQNLVSSVVKDATNMLQEITKDLEHKLSKQGEILERIRQDQVKLEANVNHDKEKESKFGSLFSSKLQEVEKKMKEISEEITVTRMLVMQANKQECNEKKLPMQEKIQTKKKDESFEELIVDIKSTLCELNNKLKPIEKKQEAKIETDNRKSARLQEYIEIPGRYSTDESCLSGKQHLRKCRPISPIPRNEMLNISRPSVFQKNQLSDHITVDVQSLCSYDNVKCIHRRDFTHHHACTTYDPDLDIDTQIYKHQASSKSPLPPHIRQENSSLDQGKLHAKAAKQIAKKIAPLRHGHDEEFKFILASQE